MGKRRKIVQCAMKPPGCCCDLSFMMIFALLALMWGQFVFFADAAPDSAALATVRVSALQLYQDYLGNERVADEKYRNRTLAVSGEIESIQRAETGAEVVLWLRDNAQDTVTRVRVVLSPNSENNKHHWQILQTLTPGQSVVLLGKIVGKAENVRQLGVTIGDAVFPSQVEELAAAPSLPADAPKGSATLSSPPLFVPSDGLLDPGWLSKPNTHDKQIPASGQNVGSSTASVTTIPSPGREGVGTGQLESNLGVISLLDPKAMRFAPFTRRVGQRILQHLTRYQRKELQPDELLAVRGVVQMEATMDLQGNVRALGIQSSSGSEAVDHSLWVACQEGAWDENPPPEARDEDGVIHLLFRLDMRARSTPFGERISTPSLQVGLR
jgi:hypothetical protein